MPLHILDCTNDETVDIQSLPGTTLLVTVPAAFSGTCTKECVPGIIAGMVRLQGVGFDNVFVVSGDEPEKIREWVKAEHWESFGIRFASDALHKEALEIVGTLADQANGKDIPEPNSGFLRRAYTVFKDGREHWQFIEPDASKYTVKLDDIIASLRA